MKKKKILRRFMTFYKPVTGIFILDSIFALISAGTKVAVPFVSQKIIEETINNNIIQIYIWIGCIVGMILIRMISSYIITYIGHLMGARMEINMRKQAVDKLHKLPMSHFDKTPIGRYISRVVNDLGEIPEFAHHAPEDAIIAVAITAGGFTYAFLQSWIIGTVIVGLFLFGLIVSYFRQKKMRVQYKNMRKNKSIMSASISDQVVAMAEIKSYASEEFEKKSFNKLQEKYYNFRKKLHKQEGWFQTFNIVVMAGISLVVLAVGAIELNNHQITNAELLGLTMSSALMVQPIQKFISVYAMMSKGMASVERFYEFLDFPEEENTKKLKAPFFKGLIEFKNVHFSYQDEKNQTITVLKNFNLTIEPGEKIAIIGETGIGKSTILQLLLRFYDIQKGNILVDGQSIYKYEIKSFRRQMGYIQQQPNALNDTIKNNILYGRPTAKNKDIIQASKNASLDKFVNTLANKYDTVIGPNGAKLSGGQKQRLSIARAFLADSTILLMDEATSALDNKTEIEIKRSIEKLSKNKTTIIIAHRLTTIRDVDKIIVMAKYGKIIETGNHKELMKNKKYYYTLSTI